MAGVKGSNAHINVEGVSPQLVIPASRNLAVVFPERDSGLPK